MKKLYLLFLVACIAGCNPQPKEFQHTILQFDTLINVTLNDVDEKLAAQAFADLDRDFEHYHKGWTPYGPSALTRMNELIKTGEEFSVAPSVLPLGGRLSRAVRGARGSHLRALTVPMPPLILTVSCAAAPAIRR